MKYYYIRTIPISQETFLLFFPEALPLFAAPSRTQALQIPRSSTWLLSARAQPSTSPGAFILSMERSPTFNVFADLLGIHITKVGEMSLQVEEEPPMVSSTCVVFAKSEASAHLREGWPQDKVLAAYCLAMAHRVVGLLERLGIEEDFAITGGIAKNVGIVSRIEKELGINALKPSLDTQIAGALGGALFARALVQKERKGK